MRIRFNRAVVATKITRRAIVLGLAIAPFLASAAVVHADTYAPGSIDGQNGWNGGNVPITDGSGNVIGLQPVGLTPNNLSEGITTAAAHSGSQSWEFSSGYESPGAGTPYSPQLSASAGLSGTGASGDTMAVTFWFKPVNPGDGSVQEIDEGTTDRQDRTGGNVYLTNSSGGVVVQTYDGISSAYQTLGTVAANAWNELTMITTTAGSDPSQETTSFSINGQSVGTFAPWADLYRQSSGFAFPTASSVKFADVTDTSSVPSYDGFYYDDLSYSIYNSSDPSDILASYSTSFEATPEPATLSLLGLSSVLLLRRRRRLAR